MNYEHTESQAELPSGEDRVGDRLREVQCALIWEADAWAIHFSLLNDSAAPMLGFPAGQLAAEEGFLKNHVHPADWCLLLDTMYRAAADEGVHTCQHRMIRTDGSTLWAQTSVHCSARSHGSPVLTGVTVDITKLIEQEQALRDAEGRSRLLIQNLREYGVFMVTLDGHVASWNPGAQQLKGYTAEEAVGAHISRFFPEDEVEKRTPELLLKKAELERQAEYEGWLVRKGGTRFWASLTLSAVTDEQGHLRGFSHVSKDLTQRRQTEQALRHSEEQFRLLVESVQDYSVFTVSPEGRVENWNRGAQQLKGYRAHEIIGSPISRFFPPAEIEKGTPERLIRDAEFEGSSTYEGWIVRKNGDQFWAIVTFSAVEDEHGRLRGFSNVAKDLTERKRVEDALREREEQLRLLVDSLQDYAFFMLSPDGYVAGWSPGAERLKGYKAEEIIGSPVSRFFPVEEVENGTPGRLIERATVEGRAEYEGWVVRASGAKFWASVILSAVKDREGNLRGLSNIARDLTERMRSERAQAFLADVGTVLAGSLDFRTTCDAICRLATRELARSCIVVMRTDDAVEPVAVADVDREKEELLRSAVRRMPYEPRITHGVGGVLQTGKSRLVSDVSEAASLAETLGIEEASVLADIRTQSCMCVPLMARGITFGAMVLVAPPGRRYAADDLRVAEELARQTALAIDNARLFQEAQTAVRLREDVLAVVMHDLRNPLSAIQMGAAQLIAGSQEPATSLRIAERIERASERMTHMIRDLLDFSSIAGGRLSLEMASHDAAGLVAEAVDALQPIASEKGTRIDKDVETQGVSVRCDRERVMQVFSNLIGNAIKFTEEGGSVFVRSRADRDHVVFSVSDTGPGISEEHLPHVFDRYWQAERKSRDSVGLGLAITKGIVESHGGSIWVESKVGQGATFFFTLPIVLDRSDEAG